MRESGTLLKLTDYVAALETLPNGAVVVDKRGVIRATNSVGARMFAYARGELEGKSLDVLLPDRLRVAHHHQHEQFLKKPTSREMGARRELVGRKKDGAEFPVQIGLSAAETADGPMVIALVMDMTERRAMLETLQASEQRFREIAENIREVFWVFDVAERRVSYVSKAYESIWGRTCESALASPLAWAEPIHPDDRARVDAAFDAGLRGAPYHEEYRIATPSGEIRWIDDKGFPVFDKHGALIRMVGISDDITERRQLEEQLRQAAKIESIGQLAGGVAHDFNNALTVISASGELLLGEMAPENEDRELVTEILKATDRAAALTRQLLAFSRQQVVERRVLDLNATVTETDKMLRRLMGEDIRLVFEPGPLTHRIKTDPGHMVQVLMNLAVNARDAMPSGGTLTIQTREVVLSDESVRAHPSAKPGPYAMLTMNDTGVGMTPETRLRVFEPFFTTKGVGKGTGLGLSVVHGIVEQNGGFIEIDSAVNAGTSFRIYFPVTDEPADARDAGPRAPRTPVSASILVVEDEESVRRVLVRSLQSAGYDVHFAKDGEEAMRMIESGAKEFDLLLTDVVMPKLGGRQLAEAARARRPNLRILHTSGYTDDAVLRHGIDQARVAFIQKPYTLDALLNKIHEVLSAP